MRPKGLNTYLKVETVLIPKKLQQKKFSFVKEGEKCSTAPLIYNLGLNVCNARINFNPTLEVWGVYKQYFSTSLNKDDNIQKYFTVI